MTKCDLFVAVWLVLVFVQQEEKRVASERSYKNQLWGKFQSGNFIKGK